MDPAQISSNSVPPTVLVERLVVDGNDLPLEFEMAGNLSAGETAPAVELQPGKTTIEFYYTATSLTAPEKVQFKYRLAGLEQDWVNAGTKRSAGYSRLPPGKFEFRVAACNNEDFRRPEWPGDFTNVITVNMAADVAGDVLLANQPGALVEFAALGVNVRVAWLDGWWAVATGSSFAAPRATALLARLLSVHPGLSPWEAKALLLGPLTVEPPFRDRGIGLRLIERSMAEARQAGHHLVILVGDEPYYKRAGFKRVPKGLVKFPGPVDSNRILVAELVAGAFEGISGPVSPDWEP